MEIAPVKKAKDDWIYSLSAVTSVTETEAYGYGAAFS
jgi:hypothetical protein